MLDQGARRPPPPAGVGAVHACCMRQVAHPAGTHAALRGLALRPGRAAAPLAARCLHTAPAELRRVLLARGPEGLVA